MFKAIAIDGPAGAGKSTIAKSAAKALNYIYVDTGALYRAIGYHVTEQGIDAAKEAEVALQLDKIKVELKFVNEEQRVFLNGVDVSDKIRTPQMSMCASKVSAYKEVRAFLFNLQRDIAASNNVIMDGRDIGTVILPNADVKIFLTASPEKRAERRYQEHIAKGENVELATLQEEIKTRDYNDSNREIVPLRQADDAVLVDTTSLDLKASIEKVLSVINKKCTTNNCE